MAQAENDLNELRALMHSPNAIVVSCTCPNLNWTEWGHNSGFQNCSCFETAKVQYVLVCALVVPYNLQMGLTLSGRTGLVTIRTNLGTLFI